jgi:hypothetical protein
MEINAFQAGFEDLVEIQSNGSISNGLVRPQVVRMTDLYHKKRQ